MRSSGNPFENHVIIDPNAIGAGFDSMSQNRDRNNASSTNNNDNTSEQKSSSESSSKETTLDMEYMADLNLFMVSTKEESEDELKRVDKRLVDVQQNITNIQKQISE